MDLQESQETFNEIKKEIDEKYQKMIDKINSIQEELDNLENKYVGQSKEWIENKRQDLTDKLDEYKQKAEEWVKKQQESLQKWIDGVKKDIQDQLDKQINLLAQKLLDMIK